tara:strand:- start:3679 stop:4797 length:1119 start_codon:yes stop_codon:yes gene_type:complete
MDNLLYLSAEPEARQSTYIENNNVDFVLAVGEGRSLVRNSVRLNGKINITNDGTTTATGKCYLDFRIGSHGLISAIQTTFNGGSSPGLKESIQNYARWTEMTSIATLQEDDYCNALMQCELRAPNELCSAINAQGITTLGTTPVTENMDFSCKPLMALNKMMGDHLPYEKSGDIRLSFDLARNMAALMGPNQGNQATYELSDLHVSYQSVPTLGDPMKTATSMRSVYNVKQAILSGSANIVAVCPQAADAVSCSFQRQDRENVNVFNNYACEQVPEITQLQFLFNDSTNKYVTYEQNDLNAMLKGYVDSFEHTGHTQVSLDTLRNNAGFGVGQEFAGFTNFSNQRFSVQLTSGINNTRPMNIYIYFHTIISA